MVVPQQCTGFSGITEPEETDTARCPFRLAEEVVNDNLSVYEGQQCAGRFWHKNLVYPQLNLKAGGGIHDHSICVVSVNTHL